MAGNVGLRAKWTEGEVWAWHLALNIPTKTLPIIVLFYSFEVEVFSV